MNIDDKLNYINERFLKNYIFQINEVWFSDPNLFLKAKVELTGTKEYITMGNRNLHIQYSLYFIPTDTKMDKLINLLLDNKDEIEISTNSATLYQERHKMDELLSNFLKVFGEPYPVICTKIINNLK